MKLDNNFEKKVYAGVLGKIIGVYLGRPFEGWPYDKIMKELGPIYYYVNDKLNLPLHVTDDDLNGTFTFIKAFKDFNFNRNITSKQIGDTWLNYCLENQAVLAWAGKGLLTEESAYLNLKEGIEAPESGSIKRNGKIIAEQIGAQIFIDGWGMIAAGDPDFASDLAKRAGSVSHDGESVYGAQMVASMEAMAFIESDTKKIIEHCKSYIPKNSVIYKLISDIQDWSSGNLDWEQARFKIEEHYGYDKYQGFCHIVPNHALIILALLFGDDDFQKTLMIVNTAGWDTDCNSGNVGCYMGIKNGLEGIQKGADFITPVNDTLYITSARGSETMTDALTESQNIINIRRKLDGLEHQTIKNNARYNFEMETSTQGWMVDKSNNNNQNTFLKNCEHISAIGKRALEINFNNLTKGINSELYVNTFFPEEFTRLNEQQEMMLMVYSFVGCPTVYSGQKIKTEIISKTKKNIKIKLFIKYYGEGDKLFKLDSDEFFFSENETKKIEWTIPDTLSNPITQLGYSIASDEQVSGKILINYIDISGIPKMTFKKPEHIKNDKVNTTSHNIKSLTNGVYIPDDEKYYGQLWKLAWVNDVDKWYSYGKNSFGLIKNASRGHVFTGSSDWKNYSVTSKIMFRLASSGGLVIRSQGLQRYYSLEIKSTNKLQINKMEYGLKILKEVDFSFEPFEEYFMRFEADNNFLKGFINNELLIEVEDKSNQFEKGMIGCIVENGTIISDEISIN